MTVTLKKRKFEALEGTEDEGTDYGQKYHCDHCGSEVSQSLRLRCATCPDYDLCLPCFCAGAETRNHSKTHPYRVIEMLDFPIFDAEWGADEELLLVEGLEMFGMGNWEQIAEHIGTKTRVEVAEHYDTVYVKSDEWPLPKSDAKPFDKMVMRRSARGVENPLKKPLKIGRPPASQPANHDIHGFMPARLEFETEFDNDAETHVGAMEFLDQDSPEEIELKTTILNIYNTTLNRRLERKDFVFSKRLDNFRKIQSIEKKRNKEEKELLQKVRVFSRMLTDSDFNLFVGGLLKELRIRQRIAHLQEARLMGVTKLADLTTYEKDKANRLANKAIGYNPYHFEKPLAARPAAGRPKADESSPPSSRSTPALGRHPSHPPLDISHAEGIHMLHPQEKELCATLRIYPRPYLIIKDMLLREYTSKGSLKLSQAKTLLRIEPAKTSKIYEFFVEVGWIKISFPRAS